MLPFNKVTKKIIVLATGAALVASISVYYFSNLFFAPKENSFSGEETEVIKQESKIKISANTRLVQKIIYLKCNDEEILESNPSENLIGFTIYQLQKLYPGWTFEKFDKDEVAMTLQVDGYCREHANNMFIGIKDGNVAVFHGKPGAKPIFKESTSIQVNNLMVQDVEELQRGMVIQSKEELLRTLEGMQSR